MIELKQYIKIRQVVGIEIILLEDERYAINVAQLSTKKNIVSIDHSYVALEGFNDLATKLNRNIPISISINGRGVLHKKVHDKFKDDKKAIQSLLPNAKIEDFFIQECISNKGYYYSVIRKQTLDKIIKELEDQNLIVIHINLGPFAVTNLFPLLKELNSVTFGGHSFTIKNKLVEDYFYSKSKGGEDEIQLDEQLIKENLLVAYASAFQLVFSISGLVTFFVQKIEDAKKEFIDKKIFSFFGWGSLIFFLLVLLINFFIYSYLKEENEILISNQSKFNGLMVNMDTLQKKVRQKEIFLMQAGWMKSSRISYYSDKIASLIPSSVLLTELSINPIDQATSKQEKKFLFKHGIINVNGVCNKPTDLNPWIKEMNELDWIERVQVNNYSFDNSERKGNFLITIYTK